MHREGNVNGVVQRDSSQHRLQGHGANSEESATGEGQDATGRLLCELSAQSCAAGGCESVPAMAEYTLASEQDRDASSESKMEGTALGSGGTAGDFLDRRSQLEQANISSLWLFPEV